MLPEEVGMTRWRDEAILDVYTLILSVFLFLTPWLFAFSRGGVRIEIWTSSLLLALTSCGAIVAFAKWEEWTSLLLGLWITAAPWIFNFQHTTAAKVSIGVGCVVAFLAALELWLIHYSPRHSSRGTAALHH
jgi:hypothetical protein